MWITLAGRYEVILLFKEIKDFLRSSEVHTVIGKFVISYYHALVFALPLRVSLFIFTPIFRAVCFG